jgi:hypothetical protein
MQINNKVNDPSYQDVCQKCQTQIDQTKSMINVVYYKDVYGLTRMGLCDTCRFGKTFLSDASCCMCEKPVVTLRVGVVYRFRDKRITELFACCTPECTKLGYKWVLKVRKKSEGKKSMVKVCSYCHQTPNKAYSCAKCRSSYYCSNECQKADWTEHKKLCKPAQESSYKELRLH